MLPPSLLILDGRLPRGETEERYARLRSTRYALTPTNITIADIGAASLIQVK